MRARTYTPVAFAQLLRKHNVYKAPQARPHTLTERPFRSVLVRGAKPAAASLTGFLVTPLVNLCSASDGVGLPGQVSLPQRADGRGGMAEHPGF